MKLKNIIQILLLILALGCIEKKEKTLVESQSKIDVKQKAESKLNESETEDEVELNIKLSDTTFRKITDLEKYKGFFKVVGMVLDGTDRTLVYLQKDSLQVLVLEQIIRNNTPKVKFRILDEVEIVADKSILFSEPTDCKLIDDPNKKFIFGLAKSQDKEFFDNDHILKVWEVDLTKDKFKEIESIKVKCFNHWFGYDEKE